MSEISSWTDEQLNEAVLATRFPFMTRQIPGYRNFLLDHDYTHDWRLCGELLEEMPVGFRVWRTRKHWICAKINSIWRKGSTPQRAICEAWLAWKERG